MNYRPRGSIGPRGGKGNSCREVSITNKELEMIEACQHCCEVLSITPMLRTFVKKDQLYYRLDITGQANLRQLLHVPIQIPRKRRKLAAAVESYLPRR